MHVYMCGSTIGVPTTFDRVPKHLQAYFYAHRAIRNGTLTCVICTHFRGPVLLVLKYFRCTRSISIDVITSHPPSLSDVPSHRHLGCIIFCFVLRSDVLMTRP